MNDNNSGLNEELNKLRSDTEGADSPEARAFFQAVKNKQDKAFEKVISSICIAKSHKQITESTESELNRLRLETEAADTATENSFFMAVAHKQQALENQALAAIKSVTDEEQYQALRSTTEAPDSPEQHAFFSALAEQTRLSEVDNQKQNRISSFLALFTWRPMQYALASFAVIALSFSMLRPQTGWQETNCAADTCLSEEGNTNSPVVAGEKGTTDSRLGQGADAEYEYNERQLGERSTTSIPPPPEEMWSYEAPDESIDDTVAVAQASRNPASRPNQEGAEVGSQPIESPDKLSEAGDAVVAKRSAVTSRWVALGELTLSDTFSSSASFDINKSVLDREAALDVKTIVATAITTTFGTLAKVSKIQQGEVIHTALCKGQKSAQLDSCGDIENWHGEDLFELLVGTEQTATDTTSGFGSLNDIEFVDSVLDSSRFAQFEMVPGTAYLSVFNTSEKGLGRLNWCISVNTRQTDSACFEINSKDMEINYFQYSAAEMVLELSINIFGEATVHKLLLNPMRAGWDFYPMFIQTANALTVEGSLRVPFYVSMWLAYHLNGINPLAFQQHILMKLQFAQLPEMQKHCIARLVHDNRLYFAPRELERDVKGCF